MLIKEQNAKRKSPTALNLNNGIARAVGIALISINLSIHTVKLCSVHLHMITF